MDTRKTFLIEENEQGQEMFTVDLSDALLDDAIMWMVDRYNQEGKYSARMENGNIVIRRTQAYQPLRPIAEVKEALGQK